ncbi:MAG: hypothetical protein GIW99_09110 [Candidatus Eremiobacteraeota bacterium]|nr:hypothetical protein [Candidatus Eremiobacteraeota bacterium]MBC5827822.1 hypothetical protein [Candidatus Eremiobacteraeota bacterium]
MKIQKLAVVALAAMVALGKASVAWSGPRPIQTLEYFVGAWNCSGSFPATCRAISSNIRFERDLGGAAILKHHDDGPPFSYRAAEEWVYDSAQKHFLASIVDASAGMRTFSSDGWGDGAFIWNSGSDVVPKQQFVYTKLTDDTMRVD